METTEGWALPAQPFRSESLVRKPLLSPLFAWETEGGNKGEMAGIAPTGKQVTLSGQAVYRMAKGKIEEAWSHGDSLGSCSSSV